ncbi:DNA-directed RNA polymerase subunit beta' [candidate division WOR-3 bacterium]|nr:DNA-directed RNA polymerase subunit beta' [candidate division WOR-3 bacterium]
MEFSATQIGIASPEVIRSWSRGEVTKAETINYRTQKPERDGLFCERIFGPVRDYECNCGKYKGIKYRGLVCERCKVEVTLSRVRRERMGHIELAYPVAHIWFYKVPPSRIGALLNLSVNKIERIIYHESYIVTRGGESGYKEGTPISQEEYRDIKNQKLKIKNQKLEGFEAKEGAEALQELLAGLDLDELSANLKALMKIETSAEKKKGILKRLKVVEGFRVSGTKPEWMILKALPVIPPDLRPLVPLEGGLFATSDLNDLYRRVITRNNRLKNLTAIKAPEIILRNEKRMLQEAVDALLDNSRRSVPVKGKGHRPLKSLADSLKGKNGRFRRNLLGKRVDYSGRSVIVVDPRLKIYECGIPKVMALELFKPFIIRELEKGGYAQSVKVAQKLLEEGAREVWEILERVIKGHPVLLNRAPTLHRLSIQAFLPKLVEGKAIRISPLICIPFNADFDGDTMSIHIPLSIEAQIEALLLMLSANNILSPANGAPISVPTQDVIIGIYWLTLGKREEKGEGKVFGSAEEVELALKYGVISEHTRIRHREVGSGEVGSGEVEGRIIDTTAGRVIFNRIVPKGIGFINKLIGKAELIELIGDIYKGVGSYEAVKFLDAVKELGYECATRSGLSIGMDDMIIPENKGKIIERAFREVEKIHKSYHEEMITESERYNTVIDTWTRATNRIERETLSTLESAAEGFNPLYMIAKSGARGNMDQVRQITGIRGLMTRPQVGGKVGEIIETPINSNFKEGLTVLEYFISCHGARKGLTDTALKTAQSGYLTRKLVDVAQDSIITESDCGTIMGIDIGPIKEGEQIIESISERIKGRFALEDIINPITSSIIVFGGEEITDEKAKEVEECGLSKVRIRSVLTCESKRGICQKCYGRNLANNRLVELGEAVGVIAAQSIGEPGTQLTLRTFHIGGTATRITKESQIKAREEGRVRFEDLRLYKRGDGKRVAIHKGGKIHFTPQASARVQPMAGLQADPQLKLGRKSASGFSQSSADGGERELHYKVPPSAVVHIKDGEYVMKDKVLFEWDPYSLSILSEEDGEVRFKGLIENVTYRFEYDERTGRKQPVVVGHRKIHPELCIYEKKHGRTRMRTRIDTEGGRKETRLDSQARQVASYSLPIKANILIREGVRVRSGDLLAKIPREITKTRDITGGLPRVTELFEARHPKNSALVAEIDGIVEFKAPEIGHRAIVIHGEHEAKRYRVSYGKHLLVYNRERVAAGDKLTEGATDPHDILKIKGIQEVQEFLVNQIQEVYRLQGVKINDKHIGVIVRQMLSKVRIKESGDTMFIEGEIVSKVKLREETEKVEELGGKGATFEPILLGITRAILTTDSFISAASFQETTSVLTEAATQRKRDLLLGIKENVIMGSLIPAGTGVRREKLEVGSEK